MALADTAPGDPQYPIGGLWEGACFPGGAPPGFCDENCAAQARVCSTEVKLSGPTRCVTQACVPETCDLSGQVCDRDTSMCVPACSDFNNPCNLGEVCTTWGECWP